MDLEQENHNKKRGIFMRYHDAPATYVKNVQLKTEDLERSIRFYKNSLGFQILEQDAHSAKFTADGKTELISLVQPANVIPKQNRTTGLYHFALLLPKRSDLALLVMHLQEQGIRFGASDHLVSEAVYFEDPDGNGIEIYADTDPSTWAWSTQGVSMDTKPLDFDDLLTSASEAMQRWNGMPPDTIIGHIHLHVSQLGESEVFYTQGLGFEVVSRFRGSALFLSTNKYHHHVALNTWHGVGAPRPPKNSAGLDFFTLVFPDEKSLQTVTANLEAIGIVVNNTDGKISVEDPAGDVIVLTV